MSCIFKVFVSCMSCIFKGFLSCCPVFLRTKVAGQPGPALNAMFSLSQRDVSMKLIIYRQFINYDYTEIIDHLNIRWRRF